MNSHINDSLSFFALSGHRNTAIYKDPGIIQDNSKLIAFYLPQFHRIPENSLWWGEGFTEWTNVAKAVPNFINHYQPHVPRELGFYDLSNVEIMREQVELAQAFGIFGFCFYYYWFSGRKILERPLDNYIASDIDYPFCLCWANENWTRTWDGKENHILLKQEYSDGDEEIFIQSILPFLSDSRYIKVDEKPLLVIYRIKELPNPVNSIKKWRLFAKEAGFLGLFIAVVDFYDISDPREVGADAIIEFPPHKFNSPQNHPDQMVSFTNTNFSGGIIDYVKIIVQSAYRDPPEFKLFRGIIPGWDNTPRRQDSSLTIINNRPDLFGAWLKFLRRYNKMVHSDETESFIFVNAWNEWGEGCHLEPDLRWGLQYLEEIARSSWIDGTLEISSLKKERDELISDLNIILQQANISSNIKKINFNCPLTKTEKISQRIMQNHIFHKMISILYALFIQLKEKL